MHSAVTAINGDAEAMEDQVVSTLYESGSQQPQGTSVLSNNNNTTEMYAMLTMATHERSSEYQQLQICTGNQCRHSDAGLSKWKTEEYDNVKAATKTMKRILLILVLVNIAILVVITIVAISPLVFSHSQSISNSSSQNDINTLRSKLNLLAAATHRNISYILNQLDAANTDTIIATLQNNISHVMLQLEALSEEIDIVQEVVQEQSTSLQIQLDCGAGEWHRIAFFNMTDPLQQCPSAWREYNTSGVRACGRPFATEGSCAGTQYSATHQYSRVCGRVIGYQVASPDGFASVESHDQNMEQMHIDGVSITHGVSDHHIWSYIAGVTETSSLHTKSNCPCSTEQGMGPASFIGENYYCESGNPTDNWINNQFFDEDRLWDGQQCEDTCCTGTNSPPWFSVQLTAPTTDNIEVHICGDEFTDNEDTPIELLEIYVQ